MFYLQMFCTPVQNQLPKKLLRREYCPLGNINQIIIPQTEAVKYLELHFDFGLNWKEHIATKKKSNRLTNKRDQLVDREKSLYL
jgi:hypothetical protein